jgi:hypothetical protein
MPKMMMTTTVVVVMMMMNYMRSFIHYTGQSLISTAIHTIRCPERRKEKVYELAFKKHRSFAIILHKIVNS